MDNVDYTLKSKLAVSLPNPSEMILHLLRRWWVGRAANEPTLITLYPNPFGRRTLSDSVLAFSPSSPNTHAPATHCHPFKPLLACLHTTHPMCRQYHFITIFKKIIKKFGNQKKRKGRSIIFKLLLRSSHTVIIFLNFYYCHRSYTRFYW